jgi:hypothetical protein
MLDFSPSIGRSKMEQAKEAVNFVLENLDLEGTNIRIGLGGFGNSVEVSFLC